MTEEEYLGDGLYASFDGWQIRLRAPRGELGDHVVYLDDYTLSALLAFAERIKRTKAAHTGSCTRQTSPHSNPTDIRD